MAYSDIISRDLIGEHAGELYPVLAYDPRSFLFFLKDGYLGCGFICQPLPGASSRVTATLKGMFQEIPGEAFLQVMLWANPDHRSMIKRAQKDMKKAEDRVPERDREALHFAQAAQQGRLDFLSKGAHVPMDHYSGLMSRNFQVAVTCKIPLRGNTPTDKDWQRAESTRGQLQQVFSNAGLGPRPMDAEDYLRLTGTIVNWHPAASWRNSDTLWDQNENICDQVQDTETDIQVHSDHLRLGNKYARSLSVKKYPSPTFLANMIRVIGDPEYGQRGVRHPFFATLNMYLPDPESMRSKVHNRRQRITYQAAGPMTTWVPTIRRQKEDIEEVSSSMDDGDRPLRCYLNFFVFADSEEESREAASNMRSFYQEAGFQTMEDRYFDLPLFLNSLPFGADPSVVRDIFRYRTMTSRHAVHLLPILGDYKGTSTPTLQFHSRNGQVMPFDLFDSNTNSNAIISAEPGAGKSVLASNIIGSYLAQGAQIWVIDGGSSYDRICDTFGGEYIRFNANPNENTLCLNPFPLVENYAEMEDTLVTMIGGMAAPRSGLTEYQEPALKRVLARLWEEHGRNLDFDKLAEALRAEDSEEVQRIGDQLWPWTSMGNYGNFFNGENNVSFDSHLTVMELKSLEGSEHLQQVILLQLIAQIRSQIFGDKENSRPRVVIIDEAWKLLGEGPIGRFLESAFRQFRKEFASAIIITQSIADLYQTESGPAIASTAAIKFLLSQNDETIENVREKNQLTLPDGAYDLLKTVHVAKGRYSEIFIHTDGMGAGVARLIMDRYNQLLTTTEPTEAGMLKERMNAGMSIPDAIHDIMREEGALDDPMGGNPIGNAS